MLFRLALALGYPHPDYLAPLLSSAQLTEWMAYFSVEPFGQARQDSASRLIAWILLNANRASGVEPFAIDDILPNLMDRG